MRRRKQGSERVNTQMGALKRNIVSLTALMRPWWADVPPPRLTERREEQGERVCVNKEAADKEGESRERERREEKRGKITVFKRSRFANYDVNNSG